MSLSRSRRLTLFGMASGPAAIAAIVCGVNALRRKQGRESEAHADDGPPAAQRGQSGQMTPVSHAVTIMRPREEVFAHLTDLDRLQSFMENLVEVRHGAAGKGMDWIIRAPGGGTTRVEIERTSFTDGHHVGWRTRPDAQVTANGSIHVEDGPQKHGTRVTARIAYVPPGGGAGRMLAKLFLREPEIQLRHDLKRFKMLVETGEVTTSARRRENTRAARQSHGEKETTR